MEGAGFGAWLIVQVKHMFDGIASYGFRSFRYTQTGVEMSLDAARTSACAAMRLVTFSPKRFTSSSLLAQALRVWLSQG